MYLTEHLWTMRDTCTYYLNMAGQRNITQQGQNENMITGSLLLRRHRDPPQRVDSLIRLQANFWSCYSRVVMHYAAYFGAYCIVLR